MGTAFVTDLEGRRAALESFVAQNPVLQFDGHGNLDFVLPEGQDSFVFGGDAVDRGAHGLWILERLLNFKERYPDRVILIQGNRDINKMPFSYYFTSEGLSFIPKSLPLWLEFHGLDQTFLKDPIVRMKFILEKARNAPKAFEYRRAELAERSSKSISDEEVFQSLLDDVHKEGLIRRYLQASQIAHLDGSTLIVHGAVTDENIGIVPGISEKILNVREWIAALNEFSKREISDWLQAPEDPRAGEALLKYQYPTRVVPGHSENPQSVMYGRYTDMEHQPRLPSRALTEELKKQGVHRILCGHKPSGILPCYLRAHDFEVLIADVSYRPDLHYPSITYSESDIEISAQSLDRERLRYSVSEHPELGMCTSDEYLVKAPAFDGRWILFKFILGYEFDERKVSAGSLQKSKLTPPWRKTCKSENKELA